MLPKALGRNEVMGEEKKIKLIKTHREVKPRIMGGYPWSPSPLLALIYSVSMHRQTPALIDKAAVNVLLTGVYHLVS